MGTRGRAASRENAALDCSRRALATRRGGRVALTRAIVVALGAALGAAVAIGCDAAGDDGLESPPGGPHSPAIEQPDPTTLYPTRSLARQIDDYLIHYGSWSAADIALAQEHDLVILDPNEPGVDRATVAAIQSGGAPGDPDARVLVLCYLSAGEDRRTVGRSDAELSGDPRFLGDGRGPRVDPRGPFADGAPLTGIDPLGLPSNGGTGWASYYLDDVSVVNDPDNVGDGVPDRNSIFGGYFVNAGDPAWFEELQDMTVDGPDGMAGLREILTTGYGRGFGCDGVFLDTFDTAAPDSWTDANSPNQTEFEWTAPGFAAFVGRLRAVYPDSVILQNRALFFFNPYNNQYPFHAGDDLDFVLYESYRLNSGDVSNPDPYFYPDNRFNFTPKLMAEARRDDGFRVLSLGYAEGPDDQMSELTLIGQSSLGFDSLLEDIWVTEVWAGFRHYLANASVTLVNTFVADHADRTDTQAPHWTSTYNDNAPGYPTPPMEPTPRVGVQEVVPGEGALTVRWDVALDLHRVGYALYYQTTPFDFAGDPALSSATRVVLPHEPTSAYADGVGPGVYANQATITNLAPGVTHYLVIRAFDAAGNEEQNQVVATGVPAGDNPAYFGRWRASNGVSDLTYRVFFTDSWIWHRVYIDRDRLAGSGYATRGIGADFLIENARLYRYTGTGGDWSWTRVTPSPVAMATGTIDGRDFARWQLPQSAIGAGFRHTRLVFEVQDLIGSHESLVYEHVYTTSDPASPYHELYAENDDAAVHYHAAIADDFTYDHVFIDDDADASTGYPIGGIGAGYLIENGNLYRHDGSGWSWSFHASAHLEEDGDSHHWWVHRSDLGADGGAPLHRVVFQANGGGGFLAPPYEHRFTR